MYPFVGKETIDVNFVFFLDNFFHFQVNLLLNNFYNF